MFTQTFAFSYKSIAFLQETLCSLKHLRSLPKALRSWRNLTLLWNTCVLLQKYSVSPETLDSLANNLHSLPKVFQNFVFARETFAFSYTKHVSILSQKHWNIFHPTSNYFYYKSFVTKTQTFSKRMQNLKSIYLTITISL